LKQPNRSRVPKKEVSVSEDLGSPQRPTPTLEKATGLTTGRGLGETKFKRVGEETTPKKGKKPRVSGKMGRKAKTGGRPKLTKAPPNGPSNYRQPKVGKALCDEAKCVLGAPGKQDRETKRRPGKKKKKVSPRRKGQKATPKNERGKAAAGLAKTNGPQGANINFWIGGPPKHQTRGVGGKEAG